jgi:hypothetical protein
MYLGLVIMHKLEFSILKAAQLCKKDNIKLYDLLTQLASCSNVYLPPTKDYLDVPDHIYDIVKSIKFKENLS